MTVIDDDAGEQERVDQRPGSGELVGDLPAVMTGAELPGGWCTGTIAARCAVKVTSFKGRL